MDRGIIGGAALRLHRLRLLHLHGDWHGDFVVAIVEAHRESGRVASTPIVRRRAIVGIR